MEDAASNLADLGPEQDAKDAGAILDFLQTVRRHPGVTSPSFVRSIVEGCWQTKRLYALPGGHGYRHRIYRRALPWSLEAVERESAPERVARGLILEHVIPMGLVLKEVEAATTAEQIASLLRHSLILAVITKEQSTVLDQLGYGKAHPDPARPWLRYEHAGITVQSYPKIGPRIT